MTTYNDDKKQALNANDFLGGNYLRKEDVEQPITATVTDVWSEDVMNDGRKKLVVGFREFHKPMVLNKTNIKRFARIFKTGNTHQWRGAVTLYCDDTVEYAGRIVGGLRVKPAERVAQPREAATAPVANGYANNERFEEDHGIF